MSKSSSAQQQTKREAAEKVAAEKRYYDYGEDEVQPTSAQLTDELRSEVCALAMRQHKLQCDVDDLEDKLKVAKRKLSQVSEYDIPRLLESVGLTSIETTDGLCVELKKEIRASVPKGREEEAHTWLCDHGFANLIKREFIIAFGKGEEKWAKKFMRDLERRKQALDVKLKEGVNPQTLGAFVREQLAKGTNLPLEALGVFDQKVSKVSVKK